MKLYLQGRRLIVFACLVLIGLLAMPLIALADNVQNDVVAGGNDTIAAGGSTTVNYYINANNGDGQTGCNAADFDPSYDHHNCTGRRDSYT